MKLLTIKKTSIKFKFTLLITLLVIVIMLLVAFISLSREENNVKNHIKFQGYALSKTLALSSLDPLLKGDFATLNNYITNLSTINLNDLKEISQIKSKMNAVVQNSSLVNYVFLFSDEQGVLVHSNPALETQFFDDDFTKKSLEIDEPIVQFISHKCFLLVPEKLYIKSLYSLKGYNLYVFNKRKILNYVFPDLYLKYFNIPDNIFKKIEFVDLNEKTIQKIQNEKAVIAVSIYKGDNLEIKGFQSVYPINNINIMDFSVPIISENQKLALVRLGLSLNIMDTEMKRAKIYIFSLTIIGIMLGIFGANMMAQRISKPLLALLNIVSKISKGKLNNKVVITTGDEIETLAEGINIMAAELLKIVSNINNYALELHNTSDIIFNNSGKSKNNIEDIREKINDINNGVIENTNSINKSVSTINKLSASAENVFLNSKTVNLFSQSAGEIASEGLNSVQDVNDKMNEIKTAFDKISEMVDILNKSIINIENITSSITRITKKTNTLSYNVSLASLKSEGKKAVINEISAQLRILSEDIEKSALDIANIIDDTKLNMTKVLDAIKSGKVKVVEGSLSAKKADESLFNIVNKVTNVKNMILKITELSQLQSENSDTVTKDIQNISLITNKTAFEVSKILCNIEEQVDLIKISFEKANELYSLANQLKKEIVRFDTSLTE